MKLTHSIAAKTAAIILLVVFLASTVLSVLGAYWLAEEGFYSEFFTESKADYFFESPWCRRIASRVAYNNVYWQIIAGYAPESSAHIGVYEPIGNLSFEVYLVDEDGYTLIVSALDKEKEFGFTDEYYFHGEFSSSDKYFAVKTFLAKDLAETDEFYYAAKLYDFIYSARFAIIGLAAASLVISIILFVFLMCSAGRRRGADAPALSWLDRIPLDLLVLIYFGIIMFSYVLFNEMMWYGGDIIQAVALIAFILLIFLLFLSFCMSFAVRAKCSTLWKNTLIYIVIGGALGIVKKICTNLNVVWRAALVFGAICLVELLVIVTWEEELIFLVWLFGNTIIFAALCLASIGFNATRKTAKKLSCGELSHKCDTRYMFGAIKEHATDLNSIGDGMARAVEGKMKSERFKTELITNVSHDIKTPLTSIVNYVDLLKKEEIENETAKEYIDVLERQAGRLKKLTEDLVEASKATTGNISVDTARVDVCELLSQAVAEYTEKLDSAGVELLTSTPEDGAAILADGRLLWRVFDNLLANICKYSLSGTRVYLDVTNEDGHITASFKNISRYPLNISADELMERFVRGDSSRTTEGSGLGLSIARSLTELQGGTMALSVDADLFKVSITFPAIS